MLPKFTAFDVTDHRASYAMVRRYQAMDACVRSNRAHLLIGKLGAATMNASWLRVSALRVSIRIIIRRRANKEMLRVHASRVVACMTNKQASRDRAIDQHPGKTMRGLGAAFPAKGSVGEMAISVMKSAYPCMATRNEIGPRVEAHLGGKIAAIARAAASGFGHAHTYHALPGAV